ncbi:MAG TPA: hypothetical protein VHW68_05705 [Actinomycetota bacterium]|nr:hypothetical protein [Actinomycetota bacterium]
MRGPAPLVIGCLVLVACGRSSAADNTQLCQDLVNLQATVAFLAAPDPSTTVGQVRGALDKLDPTFQAVHNDDNVPDAEDKALLDAQQAYRDQIANMGDDTPFAPTLQATSAIGQALLHDYEVVRLRLACPTNLEPR